MKPKISLIIPAYRCESEMLPHLEALEPYFDLFEEKICVVSRSEDRTYEIAKDFMSSRGGDVYERGRGLYESWNDAVNRSSGEYVYISTIGDVPIEDTFRDFFKEAIASEADLAISPPEIFSPESSVIVKQSWPIHGIIQEFGLVEPRLIEGELMRDLNRYAISKYGLSSLSGSFASNLARRHILKDVPFPVNFYGAGDMLWFAKVCSHIKTFVFPSFAAKFLLHEKSHQPLDSEEQSRLLSELHACLKLPFKDETDRMIFARDKIAAAKKKYGLARYLNPEIWKLRKEKNEAHEYIFRNFTNLQKSIRESLR